MKTADKRGKEKRNLSDYFELTEQTYDNHQGSLFNNNKKGHPYQNQVQISAKSKISTILF